MQGIIDKAGAVLIGITIWENRLAFSLNFNIPVPHDSVVSLPGLSSRVSYTFSLGGKIRHSSCNICKKPNFGRNLNTNLHGNLKLNHDIIIQWNITHCRTTMVYEAKMKIMHMKSSSKSLLVEKCRVNNGQKQKTE